MKYISAEEAQARRNKGQSVQVGQWIKTDQSIEYRRLMYRECATDRMGICINPTNSDKSVGQRFLMLSKAKRSQKIVLDEPVSAHLIKGLMSRKHIERKIEELGHLANKIDASRLILKESL
tara:strand:- start:50 stop:412 length:363 start_codon:yes stop_codon:yes gene_type:complete